MRLLSPTLFAAALLAALPLHAADLPTAQQIQAAVDAGVAKKATSLPISLRVFDVRGCQPSQEVTDEVVCLVGISAPMRDGYMVLPLRQQDGEWHGVERKHAKYPAPTPAEAQAAMRAWAALLAASDAQAAQDPQIQQALTTLKVTAVDDCDVQRKTGHLHCEATLSLPDAPAIKTDFKVALEQNGWRYVPRN